MIKTKAANKINLHLLLLLQLKPGGHISRLQVPRKLQEIGKENFKVIQKLILDVNYTNEEGHLNLGRPHLRYTIRIQFLSFIVIGCCSFLFGLSPLIALPKYEGMLFRVGQ